MQSFGSPFYSKTSTLFNTMQCCRGSEKMKDKISSSLKVSDIFGFFFK